VICDEKILLFGSKTAEKSGREFLALAVGKRRNLNDHRGMVTLGRNFARSEQCARKTNGRSNQSLEMRNRFAV